MKTRTLIFILIILLAATSISAGFFFFNTPKNTNNNQSSSLFTNNSEKNTSHTETFEKKKEKPEPTIDMFTPKLTEQLQFTFQIPKTWEILQDQIDLQEGPNSKPHIFVKINTKEPNPNFFIDPLNEMTISGRPKNYELAARYSVDYLLDRCGQLIDKKVKAEDFCDYSHGICQQTAENTYLSIGAFMYPGEGYLEAFIYSTDISEQFPYICIEMPLIDIQQEIFEKIANSNHNLGIFNDLTLEKMFSLISPTSKQKILDIQAIAESIQAKQK